MERSVTIAGRACALLGDEAARTLLIQPVDAHELETLGEEAARIGEAAREPFLLAAFEVTAWDDELSPWPAPPVFGKRDFGGGAARTLAFVEDELLPEVRALCPGLSAERVIIGGYSLAGLFALWAATMSDRFHAVAAASPSVWYPGWLDHVRAHPIQAERVYLSLGDREERARNPVMARVGDAIRELHALLSATTPCDLEWNPGNHFQDPAGRTAKGFVWAMEG